MGVLENVCCRGRSTSTISLLTVEDPFDLEGVAVVAEEVAMVLGTEADQRRRDTLELLGCALAWSVQTIHLASALYDSRLIFAIPSVDY